MGTTPEELGLELEAPKASGQKLPSPDDLGLEVDHTSPQALGLELSDDSKPSTDRGFFGELTDVTKKGVGLGIEGLQKAKGYAGKLEQSAVSLAGQDAVDLAESAVAAPFHLIGAAVNVADRVSGTVLAKVLDPVAGLAQDLTGQQHTSIVEEAKARALAQNQDQGLFNQVFPVRLMEDIGMPAGTMGTQALGMAATEAGKATGSSTLKEAGEFLNYVAPGVGLAAGVALFDSLPGGFAKFGTLTEEGVAAEKAGTLAPTLTEQVQQGQKALAKFKLGNVELGETNFGYVGKAAAQKASELSVQFDASAPGQVLRKFSTYTSWNKVNESIDGLNFARNQDDAYIKQFFNSAGAKAEALGLDIENPDVRYALQSAFDNPSTFRGTDLVTKEKAESMYDYLHTELSAAVQKATAAGIDIPFKKFGVEEVEDFATMSERYVPRTPNPEKLKEFKSAKAIAEATKTRNLGEYNAILDEATEASKVAEKLGASPGGAGMGRYIKYRDPRNTEAMNAAIKESFGIDNFFSNDVVSNYAETINDINKSVREKNYVQTIRDQFAISPEELILKKTDADAAIAKAALEGRPINPADLQMSMIGDKKMVSFEDLPASLRFKLNKLEKLSPELDGIKGLRVPQEVADRMIETLSPQKPHTLIAKAIAAQNLYKGILTANPGFYIRNWFQSSVMGGAAGVGVADNVKAFGAMVKNAGPWAKYTEEFSGLRQGMGSYGRIEQEMTTVQKLKKIAQVEASRADYVGDSAMKSLWYEMRQMGSTKSWSDWVSNLKTKGVEGVRDNPIFKAAAHIGHGGENIPQMAYFSKLRDEGYAAEEAMSKVNRQFLNFDNTRSATKGISTIFPFANHAIKNAEVTMRILAASPRSAMMYGPNGAFQRAVENWAGWDPERTAKYKEMMGGHWYSDDILLTVMPGFEDMNKHKDLLKDIVNTVYSGAPKGAQLLLDLPSNFHALDMIDPTRLDSMSGPLVKAGVALLGTDPFTGKKMPPLDAYNGVIDRLELAAKQFTDPLIPRTTLNAAKAAMDKLHEVWAGNAAKLGNSDDLNNTIFSTAQAKKDQKAVQKALVKVSTLWRGTFTQADNDMAFRIMAKLNSMKATQKSIMSSYKYGKSGPEALDLARKAYASDSAKIQEMVHIKEDYEQSLKKVGAPSWQVKYSDEPTPKKPMSVSDMIVPEAGASGGREQSLFDKNTQLTRGNLKEAPPSNEAVADDVRTNNSKEPQNLTQEEINDVRDKGPEAVKKQVTDEMDSIIPPSTFEKAESGTDSEMVDLRDKALNALPKSQKDRYLELDKKRIRLLHGMRGN